MKDVNEAENVWEKISEKVKVENVIRMKLAEVKLFFSRDHCHCTIFRYGY